MSLLGKLTDTLTLKLTFKPQKLIKAQSVKKKLYVNAKTNL